eukprot:6213059-Pleurochrysis_carterae.AAC.8
MEQPQSPQPSPPPAPSHLLLLIFLVVVPVHALARLPPPPLLPRRQRRRMRSHARLFLPRPAHSLAHHIACLRLARQGQQAWDQREVVRFHLLEGLHAERLRGLQLLRGVVAARRHVELSR